MLTRLRDHCWQIDLGGVNAYLLDDVADPELDHSVPDQEVGPSGVTAADDEAAAEPGETDATSPGETDATSPDETAESPVGPASVVADTGEADGPAGTLTLIDAGTPFDAEDIATAVREVGFTLRDVGRVLITHYDPDHVGGLAGLVDRGLDATVYAARPDADHLTGRTRPPLSFPKGVLTRMVAPLLRVPDLPVTVVEDGDAVGSFVAYHTPGHTPGHLAWVSDALSICLIGDLVRERDSDLAPAPWFISSDVDAIHVSIHDLADRAPAVEVVGMGHGVPFLRDGSVRLAKLGQRIE